MRIGVPKEIKSHENRVAISPSGVNYLKKFGHEIFIQTGAGLGSGFTDEEYEQNGATIVPKPEDAWDVDLVLKVKEPLAEEYQYLREGLILFTYLHLANDPRLAEELMKKKVTAIGYETVQLDNGSLPLLTPMSEVAGKMAVQIGAQYLESVYGGKGILLSGVPGVQRGNVVIIGGGVAGTNAAKVAVGIGANVTILEVNPERLRQLDDLFQYEVNTLMSNPYNIAQAVKDADLVIGTVLIPGKKAPKLVTEEMVKSMKPGSVVIDIAIDQGGIFETSDRVMTHDNPTFVKHGVLHYAVANMPGAVPYTSTLALTNVTTPYALTIANLGLEQALRENDALLRGVNTYQGQVTHKGVAESLNVQYTSMEDFLK